MMAPPPPQQWVMALPPPHWHLMPPSYYFETPLPQMAPVPGGGGDEARTLWIGGLQCWMDETYLHNCFSHTPELISAKIIRNKQTGQPEGYGFVEFSNHATAGQILRSYNGQKMPNVDQDFKLNWSMRSACEKFADGDSDYTIFVGDLTSDVTDFVLQDLFKIRYPSVKGAKVVLNRTTGRSKAYGFVTFGDLTEQMRAMTEMNGVYCSTRPIRVGPASHKRIMGGQQQPSVSYHNARGADYDSDADNTNVFVGGLDPSVTDEDLKHVFSPYGELVDVRLPVGKRCGFVEYSNRASAEEAIRMLNGSQLAGQTIRLSWGHSPANRINGMVVTTDIPKVMIPMVMLSLISIVTPTFTLPIRGMEIMNNINHSSLCNCEDGNSRKSLISNHGEMLGL